MLRFNNDLLLKKWVKLIMAIYNGDKYYEELMKKDKKIYKRVLLKIVLNNQLKLLRKRKYIFRNITIEKFENFTYLKILG